MLTIRTQTSAAGAKSYFKAKNSDYYLDAQELPGFWFGRGAEMLGLKDGSAIEQQHFDRLCDNLHPLTGQQLTERTVVNRRVLTDATFSAPKSVMVLVGLERDEEKRRELIDLYLDAVRFATREMERDVAARVRVGGASEDRITGNMVAAMFPHLTTRPVDGVPDPGMHVHVTVFNATLDQEEGKWKAVQAHNLMKDRSYYDAVFLSKLADNFNRQGYHVRRDGKYFQVEGVPASVNEKFSRRSALIEKAAAALGITNVTRKKMLAATTREVKDETLTHDDLQGIWRGWLTPAEASELSAVRHVEGKTPEITAKEAAHYAVLHGFERASVVPERKLAELALRQSFGSQGPEDVLRVMSETPLVRRTVDNRVMATSKEVINEERAILDLAAKGRGACMPIAVAPVIDGRLDEEQRAAVKHVLTSSDRVMLIHGKAGTGKTTLLKSVVQLSSDHRQGTLLLAPSAQASRGVLRGEGFENADTVARYLSDPKLQEMSAGRLLVVDEAGLLGSKDMARLLAITQQNGSRVVLVGDTSQLPSVARGTAMKLLERHAKLPVPAVTAIKRQKNADYRLAVEAFASGNPSTGIARLDQLGWVRNGTAEDVAEAYIQALDDGKEAIVVSPTHSAGNEATAAIREALKQRGKLGRSRKVSALVDTQWTEAERSDPTQYRGDEILRFFRNTNGMKSGAMIQVSDLTDKSILKAAGSFNVYRRVDMEVAEGDSIRITANTRTEDGHTLNNGSTYRIDHIAGAGNMILNNEWVLGADFAFLTHGYVSTAFGAQGRTVDRAILYQPADSLPAANQAQAYVAVSRGRESCVVFTDDREALLEGMQQMDQRINAVDLVGLKPSVKARRHVRFVARVGQAIKGLWHGFNDQLAKGLHNERSRQQAQTLER